MVRKVQKRQPCKAFTGRLSRFAAADRALAGPLFLLWLAVTFVSLPAAVQQVPELPDSLFLGTRFYLNLEHADGIKDAIVPDTLNRFKVLAKQKTTGLQNQPGLRLTIAPTDTGWLVFPALKLVTAKASAEPLQSMPLRVLVHATRAPADTLLEDIAPTSKLKGELPYWAYPAIAAMLALALIAVAILLIRRYRKHKAQSLKPIPVMADNRPNWKKALEALHQLKQEKLPEQGKYIQFHFRLSEIMKQFLEADYGFPAREMTTREIKAYFSKHNPLEAEEQKQILSWLEEGDRVKFARHVPSLEDCAASLDWMFRWLMGKRTIAEKAGARVGGQ